MYISLELSNRALEFIRSSVQRKVSRSICDRERTRLPLLLAIIVRILSVSDVLSYSTNFSANFFLI